MAVTVNHLQMASSYLFLYCAPGGNEIKVVFSHGAVCTACFD